MSSSYAPGNGGIHDTTGGRAPSKAPVSQAAPAVPRSKPRLQPVSQPQAKPYKAPTLPVSEIVPAGTKPKGPTINVQPLGRSGFVRYTYRQAAPKPLTESDVAFHQIVQAVGPKVIAKAANPRVATLQHVLGDASGIPSVVHALRTHQHLGSAAVSVAGFLPFGRFGKAAGDLAKLMDAGKGTEKVAGVSKAAEAAAEVSKPTIPSVPVSRGKVARVPKGEATVETGGALGQQVREGLRGARAARTQQDILYSEERSKRAGEFAERLKADPTMAGYQAARSALKGELPKLHFAGFENLDQPALDALVKHVADHPLLRPFEKAGTINALAQISGGKVPTRGQIKLLRQVFGREVSGDLVRSVSTWQKWKMRGLNVLNVPRSIMASFDVSAPFRQGLVVGVTHPRIFSKNLAPMFKALGSERHYQDTLAEIHARPTYPAMEKAGVSFTELGGNLGHREEQFISNMAEQIPGLGHIVRGSGRAYTGFLDKTRADVFDTLLEKAAQSGHDINDQKLIEGIASFVNSATGRGSLGALQDHAVTLNTLMFSPRLLASRLNFMNPVWYARLDPFARKEALKAAVSLVATMGLVMYVAKLAGAQVGDDPRSADFAKIKIGDTRIDLAGGFQQPVKLIAQMATGQTISTTTGDVLNLGAAGPGKVSRFDIAARFLRSKSAPVPGALWDLSTQSTFAGQPLTWQNAIIPRVTPLAGQDAYDTARNYHSIPAGLAAYGGSAIGIGVQTYKPRAKKSTGRSRGSQYAPSSGGSKSIYAP